MGRAKLILKVVGVCALVVGFTALPLPRTSPKALTSAFPWIAMTGAFLRPGIVLILVGLACLAIAALLPWDPE